ncbi:MAG TPA: protein phosphatase 2C domain-containing protein, partial [Bacillales bacterium]|nr:protein phosphatase 2C domain-containing protein [Bacillales bacterium]
MEKVFKTDCGKIREHNEDSGGLFEKKDGSLLAIVADGMGGHRAGDVASALALDYMKDQWEAETKIRSSKEAVDWLKKTISLTNDHVRAYSREHPECSGMGTTVVAALCTPDFAVVAHVGDSRGYLLHESDLRQVTN